MLKSRLIITAALFTAMQAFGVPTVTRTGSGITATLDSMTVNLQFYSPASLRVTKQAVSAAPIEQSLSVIAQPDANVKFSVKESGKTVTVKSDALTAILNTATGCITFATPSGKVLLREQSQSLKPITDIGTPAYRAKQQFTLDKDEAIYGLGNLENGHLSQRGVRRKLMPGNVEDGVPVMQSVKGYGIVWDNYSPTNFNDSPSATSFESDVAQGIDYYFLNGGDGDGVVSLIRELTGRVPMFPLWTYGFWQSRERYVSQDETVGVVNKYREIGVPLDGIIQDWQYWGNNYLWNAMEFMNPDFSNPKKMMSDIHRQNAHIIISIWSSFGPMTKPYKELNEKGLLFNIATWPQSGISHIWPPRKDYPSGVRVYDAYSKDARDIYWNNLSRLHNLDIDGWWMDSTEPDHFDVTEADFDTPTAMGSFRKVRNAYPLMTVGGVYDHQRAVDSTKRVFILTRSGYTGQQRYGSNVWTGDVTTSWHNLRNQIPALLNFSLTGQPHVNSDLGGFFCSAYNNAGPNSAVRNPLFREIYVRWMQTGVFTPMMRSHGADIKREIYYFGEKGDTIFDALADAINFRYSLLPYIYSTSWQMTKNHASMMKALPMDFAADRKTWDCADQFMFGDNLMVAPVLKAHYTPEAITTTNENTGWDRKERVNVKASANVDFMTPVATDVYLPASTSWWDFETEQLHRGGKAIEKMTTIKTIPLYVKAGTVLPLGPQVQWATQKPWDSLEVRVYPGANGTFTLYEDENDNYNYEKGQYSEITFHWNDRTRQLTIDDRKGSFPGMIESRTFNVRLAGTSTPVSVTYNGSAKTIKL